jgi:hypothetical protein
MSTWWDLGEHAGYDGAKLALHRVTCAFCNADGNFETIHHEAKTHHETKKLLNYDTLKCGNCGNLMMVLWSAARYGGSRGIHDFKCVPWPRVTTKFPEHWPADVGRFWLQAQRSLEGKNWDAAALMARSAVQLVARNMKATGANLKQQIDDLAKKGMLPPVMREWSHEIRELGNENAHPTPGAAGTDPKDARDVVEFLGQLLVMTYNLPHQIAQYRERRKPEE